MKRGGTFPRWRWRDVTRITVDVHLLGEAEHGATVWRNEQTDRWTATAGNAFTGPTVSRCFSRRCDAKRWCERMLATGGEA